MKAWAYILVGLPMVLIIGHLINGHNGMLFAAALGYIVGRLAARS